PAPERQDPRRARRGEGREDAGSGDRLQGLMKDWGGGDWGAGFGTAPCRPHVVGEWWRTAGRSPRTPHRVGLAGNLLEFFPLVPESSQTREKRFNLQRFRRHHPPPTTNHLPIRV